MLCLSMNECRRQIESETNSSIMDDGADTVLWRETGCDAKETNAKTTSAHRKYTKIQAHFHLPFHFYL